MGSMGTVAVRSIIVAVLGASILVACSSGHKDGRSSQHPTPSSTSKQASKPARLGGVEAPTPTSMVGICKIADPSDVATAYGGKVRAVTGGTTPIGHPKCLFTLAKSNVGVPGT